MINRGKIYDCYSIKYRTQITKNRIQRTLMFTDKRLNQTISKLDKEEDSEEKRILNFRKNPTWGSQMFQCTICFTERIYGHSGTEPEVKNPILVCEGSCKRNTVHVFLRVHLGREESKIA